MNAADVKAFYEGNKTSATQLNGWGNDYFRAESHAVVEVDYVLIGQADAAARNVLTNGRGVIGAVNAVLRAADVYRSGPERIARTARDHAGQIGLAYDHLRRWVPIWPLGFARDTFYA